jgi:hypothetical protein
MVEKIWQKGTCPRKVVEGHLMEVNTAGGHRVRENMDRGRGGEKYGIGREGVWWKNAW